MRESPCPSKRECGRSSAAEPAETQGFGGIAALAALLYTGPALRPESQQLRRHPRPRGGVVTQRSAKPFTPVQFRPWPPSSRYKSEPFQRGAANLASAPRFLCKASTPL